MLIVMEHNARYEKIRRVKEAIEDLGLKAELIPGSEQTAIGVLGNERYVEDATIRELSGILDIIHVSKPYKLVSRDFHPRSTIVDVKGVRIGLRAWPVPVPSRARSRS